MARIYSRGHVALRRGRWSNPAATYFLTFCTQDRNPGLADNDVRTCLETVARRLGNEHAWHLRTAAIMPDHVHLLVSLGDSNELSDVVRLFKGRTSPCLRKAAIGWQKAYFDHQLRSAEDMLPIFLYIFLNPYRANLLPRSERWPGYYCSQEDWAWFGALTNEAIPMPEWLA